jgi:serine protease AprX
MAPQATITSYDWSNDSAEVIDEITNNALLLSNHSYGIPGFDSSGDISVQPLVLGCYSSDAALWDQIAYNAPYYLMVASAGNNGDVNDDPNQLS